MEAFNITHLFFEQAKKHPDKTAIIEGNRQVSFGDLAYLVDETANYFQLKGIKKGDRVLVFVPMSLDLYRIALALFKVGATAVFLDEWVSKKRLELCCNIADCKAVIGGWKLKMLSFFSSSLRKIPIHLGVAHKKVNLKSSLQSTVKSDIALITFTTGSTGTPKAAKRTHGFLKEQFKALEKELNSTSDDIGLTSLPIVLLINLGLGCTSIVANFNPKKQKKLNVTQVVSHLQKHKVTVIIGSPYFVQSIAFYLDQTHNDLPNLKKIFTGGAPVFPREAKQYITTFPQAEIKIVYGSTEAEPISTIHAHTLCRYEETSFTSGLNVGVPANVTEVKIIPISDGILSFENEHQLNECCVSEGEIGEIIVAGTHVLDAYYNNQDALLRNKIFINGKCWHRTGDSGFIKDENLFLTGRCNMLIHSNDNVIAPFIIENLLQSIDGVTIGTILQKGTKIIVLVELSKAVTNETIRKQLFSIIDSIDEIKHFKKLPRDPRHFSKIDYEACKLLL